MPRRSVEQTIHEHSVEGLTQLIMSRGSHSGSSAQELRLLLVGNIGCGKTLSADTVLGQPSPESHASPRSCRLRQGAFEGRAVTLVEAPRWFWSGGKMEDSVRKETARAMTLLEPGPHCILLLVPVFQFTEMEGRVPAELEEMFGEASLNHTLVLLTCGDYLMGRTVEDYLRSDSGLRQVVDRCGGRYHVINNRQRNDRDQVRELLKKVDIMVQQNGVCPIKTLRDAESEKPVPGGKREVLESYRAQNAERWESAPARGRNQETARSGEDAGDEYSAALQRRRKERRDEVEGRAGVRRESNGLQSAPAPRPEGSTHADEDWRRNRTPSFKLNADGALLSQMSEAKPKKVISTLHHRINSFEEQSPSLSPTSSPRSPPFSSNSPSSSAFADSAFSEPSSPSSSAFAFSPPPLPSPAPPTAASSSPELRLVLLGRSGAGKSATGNKILGREEFDSCAITQECDKKKALVGGRRVAVVDTPDWFNSQNAPDEVRAQISSCVALSSPGPHAFLLCVPLDRPAKLELQALWALDAVFGPEAVRRHTLVLFTCEDRLRESGRAGGSSVEAYVAGQRADLLNLVERCGDRFHVMAAGDGGREGRSVEELLDKVEQMVKEAGGQFYSCPAFQEAESRVRQRQVEIARQRRRAELDRGGSAGQLSPKRRLSHMQTVAEAEEEVREDEIEDTRDEAEMSLRSMDIESLPPIAAGGLQASVLRSVVEKMQCGAEALPRLLAGGSAWARDGAMQVRSSPAWGALSSGALSVQEMVVGSSLWEKVGAGAGHVSKAVGDRVPQVVVDGSAWVGSGAKAVAASPVWGQVGSGAKLVAGTSMRVGAGIGTGAKTVARSPVWGKVGSGAKAGAQMVARSPVWEQAGAAAKRVPRALLVGAVLGLVLGVLLWGVLGGAVGAAVGSAAAEAGRRKYGKKKAAPETKDEAAARTVSDGVDSLAKTLKTE
ncbi:uncharacterized protein LOC114861897 [Betta splendens]|uniref:Uncharacterized protein LOC114861897 n=1 Tax=Betta splendens TaxID=158456 RepID=A0A6P7NIN2_BETSP|nr:uncharacterized protein LOC114861897 [Betta splendens]